jgi:hypothetical protein
MFVLPVPAPIVVVYPPVFSPFAFVKSRHRVQPVGVVTVPTFAAEPFCPTTIINMFPAEIVAGKPGATEVPDAAEYATAPADTKLTVIVSPGADGCE